MQAAIDRILSAYRMIQNLSEDEAEVLRTDVATFLAKQEGLSTKSEWLSRAFATFGRDRAHVSSSDGNS